MSAAVASVTRPRRRAAIPALTSVRFFAAAAVLAAHTVGLSFLPAPARVRAVAGQGVAGVSFFYVLSGFILTYNYRESFAAQRTGPAVRRYFRSRFARIYPVYLFSLVVMIPIAVMFPLSLLNQALHADLGRAGLAATWFANATMASLFLPWKSVSDIWNFPDWSVACECCFYLVFPWLIGALALRKRRLRGVLGAVLMSMLATACGIGVALGLTRPGVLPDLATNLNLIAYKWPMFRIPEFVLGVVLGLAFTDAEPERWVARLRASPRLRNSLLLLGLVAASAIAAAGSPSGRGGLAGLVRFLHLYWLYEVPFAAIVLALACGRTFLSRILDHPVALLLGEASYALYILQAINFNLLRIAHAESLQVTWPMALGGGLLLVLASVATCEWLEKPLRKRIAAAPVLRAPVEAG